MFVLVSALHLVPEGHFPMQRCDITDRKDAQFVVLFVKQNELVDMWWIKGKLQALGQFKIMHIWGKLRIYFPGFQKMYIDFTVI